MVEITIIIPCYNVEEYLEECLDSVINQTFTDFEVICINDGSTDNTLNILERYSKNDSRIRIINQDNKGLAASRNVGLENSSGKYICFLDADDYLDLNTFQETYDIAEDKSTDVIFFKLINFDDETRKTSTFDYFEMDYLKNRVGDNVFSCEDVDDYLFRMNVTAPGKLFKHDLIRGLKFPEGLIWEDNPFFIELMFRVKRAYFYDKHLYFRRIRTNSITQSYTHKYVDCLTIGNMIADITKDYGCYDKYKAAIFRKKLYSTFKRFSSANPEDKDVFFNKINEDFSFYQQEIESEEFFYQLPERYRVIFEAGIYSQTPEEFEYTVKIFDLKMKNSELTKEINEYKEFNESIFNSTSWKVTKPLRKISTMLKKR